MIIPRPNFSIGAIALGVVVGLFVSFCFKNGCGAQSIVGVLLGAAMTAVVEKGGVR